MPRPRSVFAPTLLLAVSALASCAPPPRRPEAVAARSPSAVAAAPERSSEPPARKDAAPASLGRLDFPITGSDACQREFRDGMLALHSFLYDQAHVRFAAALAADPRCAMAAWGDAMAHDKAIWHERDVARGRAALASVTGEEALTPRERAFLGVARALYAHESIREGHEAWLAAATAMHRDFPGDDEVVLQHALALLSVYGYDAAHLREQMEAGAMALEVLARNPQHPGAAHYTIHAFDSREHAILALPAARTYARIAPAASHALHMPSHTFTHLGMWPEVVASNERAYAASVAWERSRGHTPSAYDWHSYAWLVAAHLELGQHAAAQKLTREAGALLAAARDDSGELRGDYVSMVGNVVTQTGRWDDLEAMIAPVLAPAFDEGASGAVACAMHAPGGGGESRLPSVLMARLDANVLRAEAAIRRGDEATAVKRVADMATVRRQMAPWQKSFAPDSAARLDALADALLARAHAGLTPSAAAQTKVIDALDRRLRLESARGTAGPAMARTTHELMAEALLTAGKPKEGLAQLEKDLDERPNRALALLGAARAARAAGEGTKAQRYYATLAVLWADGDAELPELAEVREGAR